MEPKDELLSNLTKITEINNIDDNGLGMPKATKEIYKQREQMLRICSSICRSTSEYKPEITVQNLERYTSKTDDDKGIRLLYSEISKFIFELNIEQFGMFQSNIDALAEYTLTKDGISSDNRRLVMKLWDHVHLVMAQKDRFENDSEFVKSVIKENIEDINNDLRKKFDENNTHLINQNVTILGIFAATVLAFTGGLVFSTSVLNNIHDSSIYRLITIALIVGIVFINMIWILMDFIRSLNKNQNRRWILIILVNALLLLLIILSGFAYKYRWFDAEQQITNQVQLENTTQVNKQ